MKKENLKNMTLGEIVTTDFRSAAVFREYGLDFCCGGRKSLAEACTEKALDYDLVADKISGLKNSGLNKGHDFRQWPLPFLADYIVNTHHSYVARNLPELLFYTDKIAGVHGEKHPELREVAELFSVLAKELLQHMRKEEEILFPAIKNLTDRYNDKDGSIIRAELQTMTAEHEFAGGTMDKINIITNNYLIPGDGCSTYALTMKMLSEFEDDLHIHVHLENNILYPSSLRLADNTVTNNEKIKNELSR